MLKRLLKRLIEIARGRTDMDRLFELYQRKEALKTKKSTIDWTEANENELDLINKEAIAYKGKTWAQDLFVKCLVENMHFERVDKMPEQNDLHCDSCNYTYVLKADNAPAQRPCE